MNDESQESLVSGYMLAYPIYLDEAMMSSFLAHLEGGVARDERVTSNARGAVERSRKLSASAGVAAWLVKGEGSGERVTSRAEEGSTEITLERTHTSASLFNLLYEYLSADGMLTSFAGKQDLGSIVNGSIVEVVGRYEGNAYEDNIAAAAAFVPYLEEMSQAEGSGRATPESHKSRSSRPSKRQSENRQTQMDVEAVASESSDAAQTGLMAGMRIASRMVGEAASAPVRDLVVRTDEGFAVILTVSSIYYDERVKGLLRDSEFRIVGKVTRIHPEGEHVRLSRRSAFGALGGSTTQDVINGLLEAGIEGGAASETVTGPSLQLLPMAIFV